MSCRRPSNASSRVTGPSGPISSRLASTSTMGRRRRAAAIASPSRVCAFSLTRSAAISASKAARSATRGIGLSILTLSWFVFRVPSFVFRVGRFGEPLDRAEPQVPLGGEARHGPAGLIEAVRLDLVENFPALFAPADQPGSFEHDQVLGHGLAGKRHLSRQPAGAYLAVADQQVKDLPARRVADGRPELVIGLRRHRY